MIFSDKFMLENESFPRMSYLGSDLLSNVCVFIPSDGLNSQRKYKFQKYLRLTNNHCAFISPYIQTNTDLLHQWVAEAGHSFSVSQNY